MATTEAKVTSCETIINYVFENKLLCLEALQTSGHSMLLWQNRFTRVDKNDRLAVLGDTVAKSSLCRQWFATRRSKGMRTPVTLVSLADSLSGQWTQAEQALLGNANLCAVGFAHSIDKCVLLNQGTTSVSDKTMATTVEAILGAVYLDSGANAMSAVLVTLGLTHRFLEAVTFILFLSCNYNFMLLSTLTRFLDVDVRGYPVGRDEDSKANCGLIA